MRPSPPANGWIQLNRHSAYAARSSEQAVQVAVVDEVHRFLDQRGYEGRFGQRVPAVRDVDLHAEIAILARAWIDVAHGASLKLQHVRLAQTGHAPLDELADVVDLIGAVASFQARLHRWATEARSVGVPPSFMGQKPVAVGLVDSTRHDFARDVVVFDLRVSVGPVD